MARPVAADPRRVAVTNTSPIIWLAAIGQLNLLEEFFELVVVPMEVWEELNDLPGAPEPKALMALQNIALEPPRHSVPSLGRKNSTLERDKPSPPPSDAGPVPFS